MASGDLDFNTYQADVIIAHQHATNATSAEQERFLPMCTLRHGYMICTDEFHDPYNTR